MTDLAAYGDTVALTAEEIAVWLGVSRKAVGRMLSEILPLNLHSRPRKYLAGDVKRLLLIDRTERVTSIDAHRDRSHRRRA